MKKGDRAFHKFQSPCGEMVLRQNRLKFRGYDLVVNSRVSVPLRGNGLATEWPLRKTTAKRCFSPLAGKWSCDFE